MSKKHERNLRYLARAEAYARVAADALHQVGVSISQLEIGPSSNSAQIAYDAAEHRSRDLETELSKLERVVCS
jgi:uncharacterized protein (DUF3084 family)